MSRRRERVPLEDGLRRELNSLQSMGYLSSRFAGGAPPPAAG